MKTNIIRLGTVPYGKAHDIQKKLSELRQTQKIQNILLLLEHPPVITLGTRGKYENIYINKEDLQKQNIDIFEVNRGGDVTYHGYGQIMGYFIFDLRDFGKDIRLFIENIENSIINLLNDCYNIKSQRGSGKFTGVWAEEKKIAAIGISVSKWVTMHGFAFNVNTDLDHFKWINPCGLNKGVTSIKELCSSSQDMDLVTDNVEKYIAKQFGLDLNKCDISDILKEYND